MGEVVQFRRRTSRAWPASSRADAPRAIVLTEIEKKFLDVLMKQLHDNGGDAPPELHLPPGTRVVYRAFVGKAFRVSCDPGDGSDPISVDTIKSRWKRSTGRLNKLGVIGYQEPYLWLTGKPVLSKPTAPQHQPGGAA